VKKKKKKKKKKKRDSSDPFDDENVYQKKMMSRFSKLHAISFRKLNENPWISRISPLNDVQRIFPSYF